MKKIFISAITIIIFGVAFGQVGVLNIDGANITPAPLDAVEDNGQGTFTFDIFEFSSLSVPVAGSPAQITISLSNLDVIDGINSVHGYETYFDISIGYPAGVPNIYIQQKLEIPGDEYIPITIDIKVTANTDISNPNNGGNVNLTPGTGQPAGTHYTEVYTYTKTPTVIVKIKEFTAVPTFVGVELAWSTESEIANIEFSLERKLGNSGDWVKFYRTDGLGTANTQTNYTHIDTSIIANTSYSYRLSYENNNGDVTVLNSNDVIVVTLGITSSLLVEEFTVFPAYPNPFNPTTTIRYGLDTDSKVNIQIYDVLGKLTTTLVNTEKTRGWHSVTWNGTNQRGEQVPAGIYISRIVSGKNIKTSKLLLLK